MLTTSESRPPTQDAIAQARLLEHDHTYGPWSRDVLSRVPAEVQP